MKIIFATFLIYLFPIIVEAEDVILKTSTGELYGTLAIPEEKGPHPVVLMIAGSGPTDRDGNTTVLPGKNNSHKMLAEALSGKGIASLRYDKRGIAESKPAGASEKDLRFDMYIEDAKAWAEFLKNDKRFNSLTIMGHSEGSLIGIVTAQSSADSYISVAGPSKSAIATIRAQLKKQLPSEMFKEADVGLKELEQGKTVTQYPDALKTIFRPSAQPYLISWNKFDPAKEIVKLKIPILIVQGSTDIQVSVEEAKALHKVQSDSKLNIIDGMNHVFKLVELDQQKQIASYSDSSLSVAPEMIEVISNFILSSG
jgi:alpha-beta hydrolase superfamily lysophospholipase